VPVIRQWKAPPPPYAAMHQLRGGEHFIKNKIFSYSMDETWENVLKNLLEDFIFILRAYVVLL
jgi:hypothetical protein